MSGYWNMNVNFHFHCRCSFDAEHPLTEMCAAASGAGLRHLCLTDHCDLVDEYGKPDDGWSWAAEDRELAEARGAFPSLDLRRGIELGQAILRPRAAERVLAEPGIDFVLGSMHNARTGEDFYWVESADRRACLELMEGYLLDLRALAETDFFDALAHLTYPIRYLRCRNGAEVDFREFSDLIREILRKLVHRGKALELNTSGWRQGVGAPLPDRWILELYRDLGGELITIGTDAHVPEDMAADLDRGGALLEALGFRYVTLYRERKPEMIKLEELS